MLEIGIGVAGPNWDARIAQGVNDAGGASLKMWYDFCQTRASMLWT